MSLATRCPACGTVFRVVQDQLRVSQGWVRCGRCAEAFNAIEALVETPAPAPYPAAVAFEAGPPPTPTPGPIGAHSPAAPAVDDSAEPATTSTDQVNDDAGAGSAADTQAWPEPMPAAPTPTATPTATLIELPPGVEVIASDGALSTDLLAPPTTTEVRTEPAFGFEAMTVPAAVDRDTPGADSTVASKPLSRCPTWAPTASPRVTRTRRSHMSPSKRRRSCCRPIVPNVGGARACDWPWVSAACWRPWDWSRR
ncbi:MAG: zinc-ribbon domain-containing protein [Rubrivivax sp.]|nr:zinc-ribbon domain-containing protein [Rubrivivax sp.]